MTHCGARESKAEREREEIEREREGGNRDFRKEERERMKVCGRKSIRGRKMEINRFSRFHSGNVKNGMNIL